MRRVHTPTKVQKLSQDKVNGQIVHTTADRTIYQQYALSGLAADDKDKQC
jgi:hypothetical protein